MKHILFFNDSLAMGGTEVLLVDLLNHLANRCQITLLLPIPSDNNVLLRRLTSSIGVKYIYQENTSYFRRKLGENIMIFFPRIFAKWKKISQDEYDEVICFKETFYSTIFSRFSIRKILWIHNILYKRKYEINSFKERLSVLLNKKQLKKVERSYKYFDQVICVSEAARKAYVDIVYDGQEVKQNIKILYNAIDLSIVVEKAKEPIVDLDQGQTNFILITRNSPEKRTDRLILAAARLQEEGYQFHVNIIGEGFDQEEMRSILANKGIDNRVTILGRIDNPFPYILQSNWTLCVSERESFSLVLLESMALNTPVITTDCGGPSDIIAKGEYGILVENSTEGVYRGMKMVLDDPTLSVKYSQNLKKATTRFDYKNWLVSVYKILDV